MPLAKNITTHSTYISKLIPAYHDLVYFPIKLFHLYRNYMRYLLLTLPVSIPILHNHRYLMIAIPQNKLRNLIGYSNNLPKHISLLTIFILLIPQQQHALTLNKQHCFALAQAYTDY